MRNQTGSKQARIQMLLVIIQKSLPIEKSVFIRAIRG
jgi:hypothetical protein